MTTNDQPGKVLVIDDEPHVVAYLEMLLQDAGFETISAGLWRQLDLYRSAQLATASN